MTRTDEDPRGASRRAFGVHIEAAKLDNLEDIRSDLTKQRRLRRQAERVHALGPRPLGEFIAEIVGKHPDLAARAEAYAGLDCNTVRALGADRFPAPPLYEVAR